MSWRSKILCGALEECRNLALFTTKNKCGCNFKNRASRLSRYLSKISIDTNFIKKKSILRVSYVFQSKADFGPIKLVDDLILKLIK